VKVSPREKKLLIIGGAAAAAILAFYVVTTLLPNRGELAAAVELKKRMLVRQREVLGQEEEYKKRIEAYRARLQQDAARLLPGNNASIAGAELQRVLKEIADQNGVEIVRKDVQREQKIEDGLVKVSVRIETNCLPEQLVQLLASVGNYDRFLTVDELAVNSFRIQKKYEIRPSVTISGYLAGAEQPAPVRAASAR
jgi:hypothetical protein